MISYIELAFQSWKAIFDNKKALKTIQNLVKDSNILNELRSIDNIIICYTILIANYNKHTYTKICKIIGNYCLYEAFKVCKECCILFF